MSFTVVSIIIALLAGIGSYYSWSSNRGLALGLGVLTIICGAIGAIGAFFWALSVVFKLLPFLLIALGIWLVWRVASGDRNSSGSAGAAS